MKNLKKILSLAATTLIMGGLIFNSSNTITANAKIIRKPINEQYYHEKQIPITGNYQQRVLFKTRHPQMLYKPYWQGLIKVVNGSLKMENRVSAERNFYMDDQYAFFVLNKDFKVRFKFLFSYDPKPQIQEEFEDFINEFNKLDVGLGNYIIGVGRYWLGTVLFDTTKPLTALKRIGWNNFERGFTDTNHKYTTILRVDNDGLEEVKYKWGNEDLFICP